MSNTAILYTCTTTVLFRGKGWLKQQQKRVQVCMRSGTKMKIFDIKKQYCLKLK